MSDAQKVHELKIWPQYYARVKDRSKTFEVRENDRNFKWGDKVHLYEFDPETGEYTPSDPLKFQIGYVYTLSPKSDDSCGKVVFSLLDYHLIINKPPQGKE